MADRTDALLMVAELMALSARTAPKGKGKDSLVSMTAGPEDLAELAGAMKKLADVYGLSIFERDGGNIADSDACLLIGIRGQEPLGLNCRGCGYPTCEDMAKEVERRTYEKSPFRGPNCVIKMADLGIAVGSAVKTASIHNVDNRVMYTAGVAGLLLGWLPGCTVAYGIPLKASGKNIFFDRH